MEQIKKEEERCIVTSGEYIQQQLVNVGSSSTYSNDIDQTKPQHDSYWRDSSEAVRAPYVDAEQHPKNSYWDWPSTNMDESQKKQLAQQIVREEAIRRGLSIDHVESQLVQASAASQSSGVARVPTTTGTSDSSYWDWWELAIIF